MWHELGDHCSEYENLTIEEKLLVNIEMRHLFASVKLQDLCVPMSIFREAERRIIEELKRKEKNDRRNREQSAGRRNDK